MKLGSEVTSISGTLKDRTVRETKLATDIYCLVHGFTEHLTFEGLEG